MGMPPLPREQHGPDPDSVVFIWFLFIAAAVMIFIAWRRKPAVIKEESGEDDSDTHVMQLPNPLWYRGCDLNFSDEEIRKVLEKHQPYYQKLTGNEKKRFVKRLKKFIFLKDFAIHDRTGFKEMPILISAAAVQVSFGLRSYLLPDYLYIHVHPHEYIAADDLRLLLGNVQGSHISLSWKHFLEGFKYPDNGENVGLHEMAHAFYSQSFIFRGDTDRSFKKGFAGFELCANKVFEREQRVKKGLYSDYAKTNFQEFWAESVEIFFEKPAAMHHHYPGLYIAMSRVLNQNTFYTG
jgi:MtfA peptidase